MCNYPLNPDNLAYAPDGKLYCLSNSQRDALHSPNNGGWGSVWDWKTCTFLQSGATLVDF